MTKFEKGTQRFGSKANSFDGDPEDMRLSEVEAAADKLVKKLYRDILALEKQGKNVSKARVDQSKVYDQLMKKKTAREVEQEFDRLSKQVLATVK